jgi:hypothetical protein
VFKTPRYLALYLYSWIAGTTYRMCSALLLSILCWVASSSNRNTDICGRHRTNRHCYSRRHSLRSYLLSTTASLIRTTIIIKVYIDYTLRHPRCLMHISNPHCLYFSAATIQLVEMFFVIGVTTNHDPMCEANV